MPVPLDGGAHILRSRNAGFGFEQISYLAILGVLISLIAAGHSTHWTFGLKHAPDSVHGTGSSPATLDQFEPQSSPDVLDAELAAGTRKDATPKDEVNLSESARRKWGIELARVERRALSPVVVANGVVEYDQDSIAELASAVPGFVFRVYKRVGDPVRKGEILAIVDAADVGHCKAEFRKAVVDYNEKSLSLSRMKSVDRSLPEKLLRQAEADCRASHFQLVNAQQSLMNLGFRLNLVDMLKYNDDELIQNVRVLGLPTDLFGDAPPLTDNLLPLRSSFDGVVTERTVVDGEHVDRDRAVFTIANITRMWIMLHVRKDQQNLVAIGAPLQFDIDDVKAKVSGVIDWVGTELDAPTRTLRVRAEVENPPVVIDPTTGILVQGKLRAGTFGVGRISVRDASESLVVPNMAVHQDNDGRFVFVRHGDLFHRCDVEVGIVGPEMTSVKPIDDASKWLIDGCEVATEGSHILKAELHVAASDK